MQLLRDNLTLWTSDMQENDAKAEPKEEEAPAAAAPAAADKPADE
jgi:14-3-3 protein epsilon